MSPSFEYVFPAIRGIQAGREYYVSMCPLRLIPKIFLFDEEELLPELRAQRVLNKARVPEISRYILQNRHDYVFSAITASIDGDTHFVKATQDGETGRIGTLHVNMSARFIINDGQHRRAAIEMAIREEAPLADETIAVVFFLDRGLERSQQMFADLNRHAIRPSRSLGLLYDHRNDLSKIAKLTALKSLAFKGLVEMERSTLSERSRKLFTLSAIYSACSALLEGTEADDLDDASRRCIAFWDELAKYIPEWERVRQQKLTAGEVRRDLLHSHAIVLQSLGNAGGQLLREEPAAWNARLKKLKGLDWSRSNAPVWEGRALIGGRVSKSSHNVTLTTNYIKHRLGLALSPEETRVEHAYERGHNGKSGEI
ncbi:DNA sulfur modification protein DndB [Burkholderia pseudomallei]|uniref:DNA sulfur modification protein DndB n=1 Tax=Burkholderia pseudomallei TaxID=28450 RepID=UPI0018C5B3FA|nr:DNA sulfur modification protein DndB [Burkholderia pseudomallei]MBG1252219.1 DNA sulfur modification protein DndB [Burkholderia pseudomallei]